MSFVLVNVIYIFIHCFDEKIQVESWIFSVIMRCCCSIMVGLYVILDVGEYAARGDLQHVDQVRW